MRVTPVWPAWTRWAAPPARARRWGDVSATAAGARGHAHDAVGHAAEDEPTYRTVAMRADDDQVGANIAFKRALRRKPVRSGAVIVASLVQQSHAKQQMLALP